MSDANKSVIHDLNSKPGKNPVVFVVIIAALLLGVLSGFLLVNNTPSSLKKGNATVDGKEVKVGELIGSEDQETYSDEAEGLLREGGIEGEGAYHLEREGGESQYVYLTSSIIDLSEFEGRQVRVWGQTFKAEKAPWLMEVGRLELLK